MIYAIIRVSTDKQKTQNQRFEITNFYTQRNFKVARWVEETIISRKELNQRAFSSLLSKLKPHDILIVSEISRMGHNLLQIMSILNFRMENNVTVFAIKESYELGDNINSKVLAFALGLSAEIERTLISQRIKEALARKKAEGVKQIEIARSLKVHRHTVKNWITKNLSQTKYIKLPTYE